MNSAERPELLKYWSILRRRWLPASLAFLSVFTLVVLNSLRKPSIYRARGEVLFEPEQRTTELIGLESTGAFNSNKDLRTQIREMLSTPLLGKVTNLLAGSMPATDALSVGALRGGFRLSPLPETKIIEVAYESPDPHLAEQAVNLLMQISVEHNLETSRATAAAARKFISQQVPELRQRVFATELALRKFKETYNITDLEVTKAANANKLESIQDQLDDSATKLSDLDSQRADLQNQLGVTAQQAITTSALSQSTAVQGALGRLEAVELKLAEARANLTPDHPQITDLESRQRQLRRLLRNQVSQVLGRQEIRGQPRLQVGATQQGLLDQLIDLEITRKGLLQQRSILAQQRIFYQKRAAQLPKLEQRYRELTRESQAAESTYQDLLKSLQEFKVAENQTIPNVRVIEPALLPTQPIGPNRLMEAIRGAMAGALLAAALAYLLELLDRKLKSVDAIREAYPDTLLGTIPTFDPEATERPQLPTLCETLTPINEAYRMIQANLKFLSSDQPIRTITVTSALAKEGKSTSIANLGVVLAEMGHRVLLVDADLRQSAQHQIWELQNDYGLSHLLAASADQDNSSLPIHEVTQNLDVITAGVVPPKPLALLDSERMANFVHSQLQDYDYVLIDTPPLTAAADPLVLGRISDGILMIARPDYLDKDTAKITREQLSQSSLNVLGLVINGVITDNEIYSYYYYSKSYYRDTKDATSQSGPGEKLAEKFRDLTQFSKK